MFGQNQEKALTDDEIQELLFGDKSDLDVDSDSGDEAEKFQPESALHSEESSPITKARNTRRVLDFEIYQGATTPISSEHKDLEISGGIVKRLAETMPPWEDCVLCFNRFFTSVPLIDRLLKQGMFGHGTVMTNRIRTTLKSDKELLADGRGSSHEKVSADGKMVVVKWMDTRPVSTWRLVREDDTQVVSAHYLDVLGIKIGYDTLGADANKSQPVGFLECLEKWWRYNLLLAELVAPADTPRSKKAATTPIAEPSTLPPVADTSLPMGLALESEPALPGDLPGEERDKDEAVQTDITMADIQAMQAEHGSLACNLYTVEQQNQHLNTASQALDTDNEMMASELCFLAAQKAQLEVTDA
ncbi:hypothetical protein HPB51_027630 [Rhipicephalus microplus]|uniref:PiggyBac transposable element-derived protein domain-containing protein n=1 Tax=Rhipicephalus microplus TaxID=6941 RepID=A0A9J6CZQ7_RHIMP|nr:hypothetical protein HPB51_027630 [Rhipicephalus microplus]